MAGLPHSITCELAASSAPPAADSPPSVGGRSRKAPGKRARRGFAADESHTAQCPLFRKFTNRVLVNELAGMTHRVHQNHVAETPPRLRGAQAGEERRDPGPGRDEPQRFRIRNF